MEMKWGVEVWVLVFLTTGATGEFIEETEPNLAGLSESTHPSRQLRVPTKVKFAIVSCLRVIHVIFNVDVSFKCCL